MDFRQLGGSGFKVPVLSLGTGTFGGDRNRIHLVDADGIEDWPVMTKLEVAARLAERIAGHLAVPGSRGS